MATDYLKLTVKTLATLSPEKPQKVYHFAKFLKTSAKPAASKKRRKKGSVLNIVGLGSSGIGDVALNHDKYLYDE